MKVLLLDGFNLIYRARHSMSRGYKGNHTTVYSFFRSLRPLIEKFSPDKAYFVLEGYPRRRMELAPDYKGTRTYHDEDGFRAQRKRIIDILKDLFPIEVVRHGDYECDDVLANLIKYDHADDECVVISSDTDFIQLYNQLSNVELYNPIRKLFVPRPDFDYVQWKALRGDSSDNIPGFRGIGKKRATTLVQDPSKLSDFLSQDPARTDLFEHNIAMIKFHDMCETLVEARRWEPVVDWPAVHETFTDMKFFSITNDKSWNKFVNTFACLT